MNKPKQVNTTVIEARVSVLDLASILSYYQQHDVEVKSRSELLATALNDFAMLLGRAGAIPVQDVELAISILEQTFGEGNAIRSHRSRRRLVEAMQLDGGAIPSVGAAQNKAYARAALAELADFPIEEATRILEAELAKGDQQLKAGLAKVPSVLE